MSYIFIIATKESNKAKLFIMNIEQRIDAALSAGGVSEEKNRLIICLSILIGFHTKTIERRLEADEWRVSELPILATVLGVSQSDLLNPYFSLEVEKFNLSLSDKWSNDIKTKMLAEITH